MSKLKDQPLLFLTELSLINKARYNKPSVIIWNQSNFMGGLVIVWVMRVFSFSKKDAASPRIQEVDFPSRARA